MPGLRHSRIKTRVTVDGSLSPKRAGWGIVITARDQKWVSFGSFAAKSTDEIEFRAALEGLRLVTRLNLTERGEVEIVSDSNRLILACRDSKIRLYCKADWKRLTQGEHVLTDVCLADRAEILEFKKQTPLSFTWIRRCSTADHIKADALARIAMGKRSDAILQKAGLAREELAGLVAGSVFMRPSFAQVTHHAEL